MLNNETKKRNSCLIILFGKLNGNLSVQIADRVKKSNIRIIYLIKVTHALKRRREYIQKKVEAKKNSCNSSIFNSIKTWWTCAHVRIKASGYLSIRLYFIGILIAFWFRRRMECSFSSIRSISKKVKFFTKSLTTLNLK